MTPVQAEKLRYNMLDETKIWPHGGVLLRCRMWTDRRESGQSALSYRQDNFDPENYFAEVERAGFSPAYLFFRYRTYVQKLSDIDVA
ncbi:hypothetical protein BD310DRAFT_924891 [Dichomitus squalens]|uniref:Catalase core domain-containing protein n=1 Tax=Dichomitus squalens TaxID=114155 RepID=A0A4Q9PYA8_9APHY|nr:hypothetical protein BD310DRAFT_924891 [Dichomitus squalens]